jgi:hypothetical protein
VTHSASTRFLHVANGTSTTNTMESAGIQGTLSIWADPLYEGPVPGGLTDAELLDVRARYLAGPTDQDHIDVVNGLKQWRATIERHESYDELVLWFEHDLFDQLNLVQLLTWIRERLPAAKAVSLVCIGSFPGRPGFKGLGELTEDELAPLLDTRQRVSEAQYALAEEAWRAFREPSPEALDHLRRTDLSALPFLAAALKRFLEEYPSTTDGLSRTERRLLRLAEPGPVDLWAAFPRMHDGENYYITDTSLVAIVETLSSAPTPLITVTRSASGNRLVLQGTAAADAAPASASADVVTLTDIGRGVLSGERDRVATTGMDRWLGGVHLQNGADIWRWDDKHERITRS